MHRIYTASHTSSLYISLSQSFISIETYGCYGIVLVVSHSFNRIYSSIHISCVRAQKFCHLIVEHRNNTELMKRCEKSSFSYAQTFGLKTCFVNKRRRDLRKSLAKIKQKIELKKQIIFKIQIIINFLNIFLSVKNKFKKKICLRKAEYIFFC